MKKLLAVVLTVVLMVSVIPFGMFSITASAATSGYYTYTVSNGEAEITDVSTSINGAVTIPSNLGGYPVTSIGFKAFYRCTSLTTITIPDSVTSIGDYAFYDCSSLTSITVDSANKHYSSQDGVLFNKDKTQLIQYPIRKASTTYTIPDSVTSIGGDAFYNCTSLTSITIPDSVTSIGEYAFVYCSSLTSITIPDSVTSIGKYAFYKTAYYNNSSNWKNGVLYIGKHLIEAEDSISGTYTIKQRTLTIAGGAFDGCSSLTSITIPDSVTSIGGSAFYHCSSLTSITVDSANKHYSSQDGVLFNKDKTQLIQYPIRKASTTYTIPDSVTSIGGDAFYNCTSLTSITIPDSVTSIGGSAFYGCSGLTSITLPFVGATPNGGDDTHFGYIFGAGSYSSNKNYVPSSLKEVIITASCKSIGDYAFFDCDSLTSITIPDSVTSIGEGAFSCCSKLTSITIPDSVTSIGDYAFGYCTSLTSITIPDSVTSIGNNAFSNCTSLTSITIPDSVTSIGDYAFQYCSSLTSITIPDSVTSIGSYAFYKCSSLTSITIPDNVTSIGGSAFYGCTSLESITLPFVGQNADGTGFSNFGYIFGAVDESYPCYRNPEYVPSSLKNVIITGSSSISEDAFYGCNYLQTVNFVGNVKIFADWVFNDCTGLKKVTLSASLMKIGSNAFYDCINLEDVYFLGSQTQNNIQISYGNDMLEDVATWHYKSCYGSDQHSYSDGVICSVCGALKYTTGDLTGDNKINSLDGLMLLRHLNGWTLNIASPEAMDVNGDGKVNSLDGLMLLRYLNGWNINLG